MRLRVCNRVTGDKSACVPNIWHHNNVSCQACCLLFGSCACVVFLFNDFLFPPPTPPSYSNCWSRWQYVPSRKMLLKATGHLRLPLPFNNEQQNTYMRHVTFLPATQQLVGYSVSTRRLKRSLTLQQGVPALFKWRCFIFLVSSEALMTHRVMWHCTLSRR